MRALLRLAILVAALCVVGSSAVFPQDASPGDKIRVLLTTGGHSFEAEPFFAVFDQMGDVQYTRAELPKDADLLRPGLEAQYDCLVMYDMVPGISPQQREAFVALLRKGIGVVSLHHNLGAHRDWDEFRKIIGGKFILQECQIDGKTFAKTPWSHGEHLKITVVDRNHPITQGIDDFEIHDETYGTFYTEPGIHVLLTTDHPKNNPLVAWTLQYGNSRVCYLMLGHDAQAYANPNFAKLVHQAIRWASAK